MVKLYLMCPECQYGIFSAPVCKITDIIRYPLVLLESMMLLFTVFQFWIRVPLLDPEDTREDLIENEPSKQIDDAENEEKTWGW